MSESAYQRMVLGYHGCRRELGEKVLMQGQGLNASENEWDWLGRGIYFWEFGLDRARKWAETNFGDEAFVLGAFLNLGRCFDLTDTAHTDVLSRFYDQFLESLKGTAPPANEPGHLGDKDLVKRHLDCAVINYAMAQLDRVAGNKGMAVGSNGVYHQSVRGIFVEGEPVFEGSKLLTKTHVQIAVRDPQLIIGYFKPAET